MDDKDDKLQSDLILDTAPSGAAAATLPADIPAKAERPKRRAATPTAAQTAVDTALTVLAYAAVLAIAGVLWFWGAGFTLDFLTALAPSLNTLGWAVWLIPAAVTAVELKLWPRGSTVGLRWFTFLAVLTFDVGSSFAGFTQWGAGRTLPLFTGITFSSTGWPLWLTGVVLGLSFAFLPERLTRWATSELIALWKR